VSGAPQRGQKRKVGIGVGRAGNGGRRSYYNAAGNGPGGGAGGMKELCLLVVLHYGLCAMKLGFWPCVFFLCFIWLAFWVIVGRNK